MPSEKFHISFARNNFIPSNDNHTCHNSRVARLGVWLEMTEVEKMKLFKVAAPIWDDEKKEIVLCTRGTFTTYMNAELFMQAYKFYYNCNNIKIMEVEDK